MSDETEVELLRDAVDLIEAVLEDLRRNLAHLTEGEAVAPPSP